MQIFLLFLSLVIYLLYGSSGIEAYIIEDFSILDLHDTDHALFLQDVSLWTLSSSVSTNKTEVTTAYNLTSFTQFKAPSRIMLGGYNILGPANQPTLNQYFEREYSGLGPHTFLTFELVMFFIDQYWSGQSQVMEFHVNNAVVPGTQIKWISDSWALEAGQSTQYDVGFVHVRGRVSHMGSSLNFRVVSTTPESSITAPFGFRELSIYLSNYTTNTSTSICQTTPEKNPLSYNQCDCQLYQAKDATGICQNCTNNCKHCFGMISSECYLCNDDAFWTGSGCGSCDSSCETCTGPSNLECVTCSLGYTLSQNGSCSNMCQDPFTLVIASTSAYCESPCNATEYYWAANQSCLANCSLPLISSEIAGGLLNVCQSPCNLETDYIYQDGSCSSTCDLLFVIKQDIGAKYCLNPCPSTEKYLYPDSTCKSTCEYPYRVTGNSTLAVCELDLDTDTVKEVQQLAQASEIGNSLSNGGGMVGTLLSASDPASMCLGPFAKMLQYIKFMDIRYPPKVQLMLESQDTSSGSLNFLSKPMRKFINSFKNQTVPGKFNTYRISSSFIVNFWQSALMLLAILVVILLGYLFLKSLKKTSKIYTPVETIVLTLKWNFFLIIYCGTIGDIVLYSALEFQTIDLEDFFSNLSLFVCAGFNALTLVIVIKIIHVNFNLRQSKDQAIKEEQGVSTKEIEKKWVHFRAFFETYKDTFFGQQIFLLIFVLRVACFNAIVGYAFKNPFIQALSIVIINLIMAVYLIVMRPMKSKINLVQQITFELLLLIFNTSVFMLAVADDEGSEAVEFRKVVGNIIISLNIIVPFLSFGFIVLKIVIIGVEAYKNWKKSKNGGIPQITISKPQRNINSSSPSYNGAHKTESSVLPHTITNFDINQSRANPNTLEISNYESQNTNYLATSFNEISTSQRLNSSIKPSLHLMNSFNGSPLLNPIQPGSRALSHLESPVFNHQEIRQPQQKSMEKEKRIKRRQNRGENHHRIKREIIYNSSINK